MNNRTLCQIIEQRPKKYWKTLFPVIIQLADLSAFLFAALIIAMLQGVPYIGTVTPTDSLEIGFLIFVVVFFLLGAMFGLYRGAFHTSVSIQNIQALRTFLTSLILTIALLSMVKGTYIGPRALSTFLIVAPFSLFASRMFLKKINLVLQERGYGIHNSLIVGYGDDALRILRRFRNNPELGYRIKGFVVNSRTKKIDKSHFLFDELNRIIPAEKIDRIFIPSSQIIVNGYSDLIKISNDFGVKLKILSPESDRLLRFSRIHDISGVTLTTPQRGYLDNLRAILKRTFDLLGAILLLTALSPVFLLATLGILVESGRPIFFLQRRSALKHGKEFDCVKFRSMVSNADELKKEIYDQNESDGALFKLKRDPRVTSVGRIIRRFSIDELPQLFNVLKGDMSLVGPRPLPISDFERIQEPEELWEFVKERATVLPGMTGLWQISGRSDVKFRDMILLDLYYVENQSLLFDLEILFETIPAVLFGKGAY